MILDLKLKIYVKGEYFPNDKSLKFIVRKFGSGSTAIVF